MSQRQEQVNSNIHRELSQIFSREIDFPNDCLVTISQVKVSDDLRWVQIWLSILPITARAKVRKKINKSKGHIQGLLNRRLRMQPMPRLQFFTDFTEEHAVGIEAAIDNAMKEI